MGTVLLVVNNKPTRCFCLAIHLITSLLHGVDLLEKVTGSQLVKKFPTFYGTRRFNTAFICARHLSLSCATSVQFIPPHPNSWRYNLILPSHLRLGFPSGLFLSGFPINTLYTILISPIYATCPAHLILLNLITPKILGEHMFMLRFTNWCDFCNISLLYVSTLHVSGLYRPIIRGIPSCCLLLPLGSCGAWRLSACVWVLRCWLGEQYRSLSLCGFFPLPRYFFQPKPKHNTTHGLPNIVPLTNVSKF